MNKICLMCNKEFKPKRKEQKFCCTECGHLSKKGVPLKKQKRVMIKITCPICNTKFMAKNDGRKKTCSISCARVLTAQKISGEKHYKYNHSIPIMLCGQCGKSFRLDSISTCYRKGRGQFCSKRCHNESMKKEKIKFTCIGCGKVFWRRPGRAKSDPNFYCSKKCYLKYGVRGSYKVNYICNWLLAMGYMVEREKTFNWLRNPKTNHNLFIDIFIPELKIAIEYDGKQHFTPCLGYDTEKDVLYRQELDSTKNNLCTKNGISSIRISYDTPLIYENFIKTLFEYMV